MSKKTKNKSVNVNNLDKNEKSKTTKDSSKFKIVFGVFAKIISYLFVIKALFTIYCIYLVYVSLTNVPDLPKVDVNVRWGVDNNTHDTRIRPYRVIFSDAMESEIRALFEDYRLMERKIRSFKNTAWTYGVHSDAFAQFFSHWIFKYKFRERVKFLNKYDHFLTNIQGLDIHFVRVKPKADKNVKVVPLLLLHGWPGSVREFYEAIPLLTTPRPDYDFVFEVIAPSLPGFVFSEAPTRPGLDTYEMAIIMRNLMRRLGYTQYYIQGGDFGHMIGSHIATIFPSEVLGFHTNFPVNTSKLSLLTWLLGGLLWPSYFGNGIEDRMYPLKDKLEFYLEETGYSHLQSTKPDTIGELASPNFCLTQLGTPGLPCLSSKGHYFETCSRIFKGTRLHCGRYKQSPQQPSCQSFALLVEWSWSSFRVGSSQDVAILRDISTYMGSNQKQL